MEEYCGFALRSDAFSIPDEFGGSLGGIDNMPTFHPIIERKYGKTTLKNRPSNAAGNVFEEIMAHEAAFVSPIHIRGRISSELVLITKSTITVLWPRSEVRSNYCIFEVA